MPELLHSEAAIGGNCAQARSKRSICIRLRGADRSSAEMKWLIAKTGVKESIRTRARGRSRAGSPSRFMPVSIWIAAGWGAPSAAQNSAHSVISGSEPSTGMSCEAT